MNPPQTQAPPSPPPPAATRRPEFFEQLDRFWLRVTEGLELGQLWKQFSADARSSYRLYHRDFQARAPQDAGRHRFWHTAQEFIWAILEKLTPARRVLLLLGLLLLIFPAGGFSYHGKTGEVEIVELDLRFWGGAVLFVLLMLEVAGKPAYSARLEHRFRYSPCEYGRR
jgi:phosphoserine phosphatase RsbU/P